MLTQNLIDKLESKGLVLFGKHRDFIMVCKPVSIVGNCIAGQIHTPIIEFEEITDQLVPKEKQFETDAPVLGIFIEQDGFRVEVWQWVPGPGPGDFEKCVSTEEAVYDLTVNYFFEKNKHFEAYKSYRLKNKEKGN